MGADHGLFVGSHRAFEVVMRLWDNETNFLYCLYGKGIDPTNVQAMEQALDPHRTYHTLVLHRMVLLAIENPLCNYRQSLNVSSQWMLSIVLRN